MRHLLAFTSAGSTTFPTQLNAVTSDIFPISSNSYILQGDYYVQWVAAIGTFLTRCNYSTPTLNAVNPINLAQLNSSGQGFPSLPAVYIPPNPTHLKPGESLSVNSATSSSTNQCYCFIEISNSPNEDQPPPGDEYVIRFTSSTTLVQAKWTTLSSVVFETASLPSGNFVVTGGQVQSATAVAWRVFNAESKYRAGGLGITSLNNQSHPYFINRPGRVLCKFNSLVWPTIEVMSDAADTTQVGHLIVKRAV